MLGAGCAHRVLERLDVVIPQRPFEIVGFADLPVAVRVIEALRETGELFLPADVQEEFEDSHAVFGEQRLEVADALVARHPGLLVDQLVDPRHQHVLVVRAVEDDDLTLSRRMGVDAPEKVVRELGRGRLFEAGDARALGVERGEYVLDRAILSSGVERLQDDEDRVLVLGVEQGLLVEQLL